MTLEGSDTWNTPRRFVDLARAVMGGIDVDPASNVEAQVVVQATAFYTLETDGMAHEWPGRIFLNPPYSDPAPFVSKLLAEVDAGRTTEAVVLVNARTGAAWFQALAVRAWRCELRQRVKFWRPERPEGSLGRQDSVAFYFGSRQRRFIDVFRPMGVIAAPAVTAAVTLAIPRACGSCGGPVAASRVDAKHCSNACRQRAYRRRQVPRGRALELGPAPGQGEPANEPSEAPASATAGHDHDAGQSRNVA